MPIDQLPPLRQVIEHYDLQAKKSLGQNFLLDLNLTSKIARQAGDLHDVDVLEVGPGPGGLTRAILAEGARHVTVIERDQRFLPALNDIARHYPDRLTIVEGDALSAEVTLSKPIKILANLPYNVGTELLIRWLTPGKWPPDWSSLTLMFQKEVAERLVAQPSSKAYGRLSVLAQWRCDVRIAMRLPPQAFLPPPKVESAVVHVEALPQPRFPCSPSVLEHLTAKAFGQRRKMLRSSLKGLHDNINGLMEASGIEPTRRAETLSVREFCLLAEKLEKP